MIVNLELTFATGEARWRPAATGLLMAWNVSSARMQSWLKRSTASSRRLPAKPILAADTIDARGKIVTPGQRRRL